jgi:hypothetical protein
MTTSNPNRVQPGVPAGGQFAAQHRPESDLKIGRRNPFVDMSDDEIIQAVRQAFDSATPSFLEEVASADAPELRMLAAQNPNTPEPALERLSEDTDRNVSSAANTTLRFRNDNSDPPPDVDEDDEPDPEDPEGPDTIPDYIGAVHYALFPEGETQRARRGHEFLPPELIHALPELYSTEGVSLAEKQIHAHYFVGGCDWYIAELDRSDGTAFGHCDLGMGFPEWGYVNLVELESTSTNAGFPVERDCYFTPATAKELGLA